MLAFATGLRARVHLSLPLLARGVLADAELVVHIGDPGHGLGEILGHALGLAAGDRPGERDLPVRDLDLDLAGVDLTMLGEPLAEILFDTLIGSLVALREIGRASW